MKAIWRLVVMTDYEAYLSSTEWRSRREEVLERDRHRCQTCLSAEDLEVHHKTYERLGNEDLDDLITLCHDCHEAITAVIRRRRYKGRAISLLPVQRLTPVIERSSTDATIEIQAHIRITPLAPQRANRRPLEQILQDAEASQQQERQDGRRF